MRQVDEGAVMNTITVVTRLDRKYFFPGTVMVDPYTEERKGGVYGDGHLYLVSQCKYKTAILCEAIVDVKFGD